MQVQDEFVVGKHNIGWVSSYLIEKIGEEKLEQNKLPTFQILSRHMTDSQIESELKPGICTMSDIYSFLKNPPQESKDGNWNLFYTRAFVIDVRWGAGSGEWHVDAWQRDGNGWNAGIRVFSPATKHSVTEPSALSALDPTALPEQLTINGVLYRKV